MGFNPPGGTARKIWLVSQQMELYRFIIFQLKFTQMGLKFETDEGALCTLTGACETPNFLMWSPNTSATIFLEYD